MNVKCLIIGDIFMDFNMKMDEFQLIRGGIVHCNQAKHSFGGSGNISAALSLLGISNYFIGKAGNDAFGDLYRNDLEEGGAKTKIFYDHTLPTGILVSVIDNLGERSFIVARGANDNLTTEEVENAINEIEYELLYITGYSLVNSPQREAVMYAANHAHRKGAKIFFDPGAFNIIGKSQKYFDHVLKLSHTVSANVQEAQELSRTSQNDEALRMLSDIVPNVVMKLGKGGCIISSRGTLTTVPAPVTYAVDSTGAGDAFNAALVYGIINNWSHRQVATFANWFASKKVGQLGARAFPLRNEVNAILDSLQ